MTKTYNEAAMDEFLSGADVRYTSREIVAIARGVAAAPRGILGNDWASLVVNEPTDEVREGLADLLAFQIAEM